MSSNNKIYGWMATPVNNGQALDTLRPWLLLEDAYERGGVPDEVLTFMQDHVHHLFGPQAESVAGDFVREHNDSTVPVVASLTFRPTETGIHSPTGTPNVPASLPVTGTRTAPMSETPSAAGSPAQRPAATSARRR